MKTESIVVTEELNVTENQSVEHESALRTLQESELMLIGGGGGDVVFG